MAIYNNITFGNLTLQVTSINVHREPKTKKQIIGSRMVDLEILGTSTQQWKLSISGIITSDSSLNLKDKRIMLQSLDNARPHDYVDGYHDGVYVLVPNTLRFSDIGEHVNNMYEFTMELVEF